MRPRWTVAKREVSNVFRERTILLAVVIQVFVAGFSSFLVAGLSALVDPDSMQVEGQPVVGIDDADLADALLAAGLDVRTYPDRAAAVDAFRAGAVDAALVAQDVERLPERLTLVLPDGDFRATVTLVKVKAALEAYEEELRGANAGRLTFEPLRLQTDATAGSYAFVYSMLVPLLVLLPVVLAGALAADSLTEEVQRGTLPLLLASPATAVDVVEGKLLANVALVPLLVAAWLGLLAANGLRVPWTGALLVALLATALAAIAGLLACAIALAVRDRNRAHLLYATALFLLLGLALALPVSPVNAIARFSAGSPSSGALAVVVGATALAVAGWAGLRAALARWGGRLATAR